MGLRIQNNVEAFNTHRQLTATGVAASKSMEKLSSGYRINRAADDAAGLAISEKMRGQIGGLAQAQRNAQDGISLVQTAEGALTEVHSMLQRVRELAVQYAQRHARAPTTRPRSPPRSRARRRRSSAIRTRHQVQRHQAADGSAATVTFQVGANDNETITRHDRHAQPVGIDDGGLRRPPRSPPTARSTAPSTGGLGRDRPTSTPRSGTSRPSAADFGAVQNRLEHRLATSRPTGEPDRVREADP